MKARCVNCGAPGKGPDCAYCDSPLEVLRPDADQPGFEEARAVLQAMAFDPQRVEALRSFVNKHSVSRFTAGQVRELLAQFTFDPFRLEAARELVPLVLDRKPLYHAADAFLFDPFRVEFIKLLTSGGSTTPTNHVTNHVPKAGKPMTEKEVLLLLSEATRQLERDPSPPGNPTALLVAGVLVSLIFGIIVLAGFVLSMAPS